MNKILTLSLLISLFFPLLAGAQNSDYTRLPQVLLIGDSISEGYIRTVRSELAGKADVTRIPGNGQWTGTGVKKIDEWLGDTGWDVIHFNWGLWDMYGWEFAEEDRSPEAYGNRLETLVSRLEKTGAKLIWATTTPACPEAEVTMRKRFNTEVVISEELEKQYLDAAAKVMKAHNVKINDLHALIRPDLAKHAIGPDDVHFNAEGSKLLGKQVAKSIAEEISE